MQCTPVHDGPFFFERGEVYRCEGCRALVTPDQVRASARAVQGGADGNALQRELVAPRRRS